MTETMKDTTDSLDNFLDGVEQELQNEDAPPTVVYGPEWAQSNNGAEAPPENLEDPVWAPSTGWMEKSEAPIHADHPRGVLAMYAPDSKEDITPT